MRKFRRTGEARPRAARALAVTGRKNCPLNATKEDEPTVEAVEASAQASPAASSGSNGAKLSSKPSSSLNLIFYFSTRSYRKTHIQQGIFANERTEF